MLQMHVYVEVEQKGQQVTRQAVTRYEWHGIRWSSLVVGHLRDPAVHWSLLRRM